MLVLVLIKYSLGLNSLTLYRKEFKNAYHSTASTQVCYLFPVGMLAFEDRLKYDVANKIAIVSNTFALSLHKPTKLNKLKNFYQMPIYV
ncbi:hypothetical protein AWH60_03735 [Pseudoalteromonas haloplanktis]|nr:hypothetical protein AWH60_03735 [Pseudoalteromonas haloplanktis]